MAAQHRLCSLGTQAEVLVLAWCSTSLQQRNRDALHSLEAPVLIVSREDMTDRSDHPTAGRFRDNASYWPFLAKAWFTFLGAAVLPSDVSPATLDASFSALSLGRHCVEDILDDELGRHPFAEECQRSDYLFASWFCRMATSPGCHCSGLQFQL